MFKKIDMSRHGVINVENYRNSSVGEFYFVQPFHLFFNVQINAASKTKKYYHKIPTHEVT